MRHYSLELPLMPSDLRSYLAALGLLTITASLGTCVSWAGNKVRSAAKFEFPGLDDQSVLTAMVAEFMAVTLPAIAASPTVDQPVLADPRRLDPSSLCAARIRDAFTLFVPATPDANQVHHVLLAHQPPLADWIPQLCDQVDAGMITAVTGAARADWTAATRPLVDALSIAGLSCFLPQGGWLTPDGRVSYLVWADPMGWETARTVINSPSKYSRYHRITQVLAAWRDPSDGRGGAWRYAGKR